MKPPRPRTSALADVYQRTINTLTRRRSSGCWPTGTCCPSTSFPTDTVELRTSHTGDAEGARVELSRDLSSAIYEYAPGSGGRRRRTAMDLRRRLPATETGADLQPLRSMRPVWQVSGRRRARADVHGVRSGPRQGDLRDPRVRLCRGTGYQAPGLTAPKRSWHGATYVLSPGADVRTLPWPLAGGGSVVTTAGERGTLVAISDGPGGSGYFLCEWCGWGTPRAMCAGNKPPKSHQDPLRARDCTGTLRLRSLAHKYETDLLEVDFGGYPAGAWNYGQWRSVLYALLEGASDLLEISRDDIDGTLYPGSNGEMALVTISTQCPAAPVAPAGSEMSSAMC